MKRALITGVTGQDGSYLSELLLEKGYEVHGIKRRASSFNTQRIDHLFQEVHDKNARFILHYGDLSDSTNLEKLVYDIQPDEIYNLAAQSHVKVSWDCPEYTADCDALGTLRLLEAIRMNHLEKKTKFYQASTSELYGLIQEPIQKETTPFYPRSPYAVAKLYAYWICVNYRESFGLWAANGILFNHESPRRGETFVTRKITMAATKIKVGLQDKIYLGNLNAKRDWGHAKDYVRGMWQIMQQDKPTDYVLATGTTTSIRDFCKSDRSKRHSIMRLSFIVQSSMNVVFSYSGRLLTKYPYSKSPLVEGNKSAKNIKFGHLQKKAQLIIISKLSVITPKSQLLFK